MRTTLIALTAFSALAVAAFSAGPVNAAGNRAVCLHGGQTFDVYDCAYDTMAQCRATLSGTTGSCDVNPQYIARGFNPQDAYDQQYSPTPRRAYRRSYYNGY